jgi:hypothetical protein
VSKKVKKITESDSGYIIWKGGSEFEFQRLDGQKFDIHPESVDVFRFLRKRIFIKGYLKKNNKNQVVQGSILITKISTNIIFN